jgi:PAS domain S-box-containing protein
VYWGLITVWTANRSLNEYAVIAIDNAALYSSIAQERNKLDTILNHIQDGVIVIDQDQRLLFANRAVQEVFDWGGELINGQSFEDLISQPELLELMRNRGKEAIDRTEVSQRPFEYHPRGGVSDHTARYHQPEKNGSD